MSGVVVWYTSRTSFVFFVFFLAGAAASAAMSITALGAAGAAAHLVCPIEVTHGDCDRDCSNENDNKVCKIHGRCLPFFRCIPAGITAGMGLHRTALTARCC